MSSSDPGQTGGAWYHFAGIGGSGMSALAQFHALAGGRATGSDRAFDQGERQETARQLAATGVGLSPQDGSGLATPDGEACEALVVSTAVEETVPDVQAARRLGVPILHRSELLAQYVSDHRTIAVTGTSGKSTVTAMIFEILRGAGLDPSLLTGGNLMSLQRQGYLGNAWAGEGDLLVIEADESDGSLVRYAPWVGVVLNLRLDHKPPAEIAAMFATFAGRTTGPLVIGEQENLRDLAREREAATNVCGLAPGCDCRAENVTTGPASSEFFVNGVGFTLPLPGDYNVRNAVAAIAACRAAGVEVAEMVAPLAAFAGVARRFQSVGTAAGVEVVDDFAHNPDKIGAALAAARVRVTAGSATPGRILAVFQPHGFGPTRFLKEALVEALAVGLTAEDRLWMPEIYYAGGTVTRDISAADITREVSARGVPAEFCDRRADIVPRLVAAARPGDLVLVMGARDPSLTGFCQEILARLGCDR